MENRPLFTKKFILYGFQYGSPLNLNQSTELVRQNVADVFGHNWYWRISQGTAFQSLDGRTFRYHIVMSGALRITMSGIFRHVGGGTTYITGESRITGVTWWKMLIVLLMIGGGMVLTSLASHDVLRYSGNFFMLVSIFYLSWEIYMGTIYLANIVRKLSSGRA